MADDKYLISVAKSEYRDGYNSGDVTKVLSAFAPGFLDMSVGQPSFFGATARAALEKRLLDLFAEFDVSLEPLIVDIVLEEDLAFDYGWHEMQLRPKRGGPPMECKLRYFERWSRQADGEWKIIFLMTNKEEQPRMEPLSESAVARALCEPTSPRSTGDHVVSG